MKLKKIAGVYHAQFRTATGARRMISTKQTDREQALAVVKQAGIAEMERAALAGKLSREVVGRILTGKRMTVAKAVAPFREWMKARGRSPKTIAEVEGLMADGVAGRMKRIGSKPFKAA